LTKLDVDIYNFDIVI